MNYQRAREIVKERAGAKYRGTALQLIQKLTNGLYDPNDDKSAVEDRVGLKKITTMCGWVGVQDRQLRRLLEEIEEVTVISWQNGRVKYRMNLETLESVEKLADKTKRERKERDARRTEKATETRKIDRLQQTYLRELAEMARAMQPFHELLETALVSDKTLSSEAVSRINAARERRNVAEGLATNYIRVREEHGTEAAEQMIRQYIAENPDCPTAQEIKRRGEKA